MINTPSTIERRSIVKSTVTRFKISRSGYLILFKFSNNFILGRRESILS